jgi:hypothetical protein
MKKKHLILICSLLGCFLFSVCFYCARILKERTPPVWAVQQISNDLEPFTVSCVTAEMLDAVFDLEEYLQADWGLVRYRIKDGQVEVVRCRPHLQTHPRFHSMVQSWETLAKTTSLPDIEFILTLEDSLDGVELPGPVFAFAKNVASKSIVLIPDFEALSGNSRFMKGMKRGMKKYPWEQKESKAFWRGSMTGGSFNSENFLLFPRTVAVSASLKFPYILDCRFSQTLEDELIKERFAQYFASYSSVADHLKYKYQLLIDGNSSAYSGAYWRLFSDCLVLKQSSQNIQWYYGGLQPYVHYIPLQGNLEDLVEKIEWAIAHEKEALQMAKNATEFAQKNLNLLSIYQYLYLLLVEYSNIFRGSSAA